MAFTLIKSPGTWNNRDMDFILENGDTIYKSLKTEGFVAMDELHHQFSFKNVSKFKAISQNYSVYPVYLNNLHLYFVFDDTPIDTSGYLFTLRGLTMSVTWTRRYYFLFDSQSRDFDRKTCPGGFSFAKIFSQIFRTTYFGNVY